MKIAFSPIYAYQLPSDHRFPMIKYELLAEQLLRQNIIDESQFFAPKSLSDADILTTHTEEYLYKLSNLSLSAKEERKIGFPVRKELVDRGRVISSGTLECALWAMQEGVALNIAGGTHHAFPDHGEGFCVFNDFAIASNCLLQQQLVDRILIVDLDVHQGNGTAHIFRNNKNVFTFSMHGGNNYPLKKEKSDLDIPLPDKTNDSEYLNILKSNLPKIILNFRPNLIFYLSGVDILESDRLGRLSMTLDGSLKRDQYIFELCREHRIPVAVSMGGGYSPQIKHIIDAHTNTFIAAKDIFGA